VRSESRHEPMLKVVSNSSSSAAISTSAVACPLAAPACSTALACSTAIAACSAAAQATAVEALLSMTTFKACSKTCCIACPLAAAPPLEATGGGDAAEVACAAAAKAAEGRRADFFGEFCFEPLGAWPVIGRSNFMHIAAQAVSILSFTTASKAPLIFDSAGVVSATFCSALTALTDIASILSMDCPDKSLVGKLHVDIVA